MVALITSILKTFSFTKQISSFPDTLSFSEFFSLLKAFFATRLYTDAQRWVIVIASIASLKMGILYYLVREWIGPGNLAIFPPSRPWHHKPLLYRGFLLCKSEVVYRLANLFGDCINKSINKGWSRVLICLDGRLNLWRRCPFWQTTGKPLAGGDSSFSPSLGQWKSII